MKKMSNKKCNYKSARMTDLFRVTFKYPFEDQGDLEESLCLLAWLWTKGFVQSEQVLQILLGEATFEMPENSKIAGLLVFPFIYYEKQYYIPDDSCPAGALRDGKRVACTTHKVLRTPHRLPDPEDEQTFLAHHQKVSEIWERIQKGEKPVLDDLADGNSSSQETTTTPDPTPAKQPEQPEQSEPSSLYELVISRTPEALVNQLNGMRPDDLKRLYEGFIHELTEKIDQYTTAIRYVRNIIGGIIGLQTIAYLDVEIEGILQPQEPEQKPAKKQKPKPKQAKPKGENKPNQAKSKQSKSTSTSDSDDEAIQRQKEKIRRHQNWLDYKLAEASESGDKAALELIIAAKTALLKGDVRRFSQIRDELKKLDSEVGANTDNQPEAEPASEDTEADGLVELVTETEDDVAEEEDYDFEDASESSTTSDSAAQLDDEQTVTLGDLEMLFILQNKEFPALLAKQGLHKTISVKQAKLLLDRYGLEASSL